MSNPPQIEERVNEVLHLFYGGDQGLREVITAAMTQLHDEVLEEAARIVEAPFTGVPHTDYAKTRAAIANTLAKDVRAAKLTPPQKRERRVEDERGVQKYRGTDGRRIG